LDEFHRVDKRSTGQKSHRVDIYYNYRDAMF